MEKIAADFAVFARIEDLFRRYLAAVIAATGHSRK